MKRDVTLHVKCDRWKTHLKPHTKLVQETIDTALANVSGECSVAVVLADDDFIRVLNHDYRGKNLATNVLSFPSELVLDEARKNSFLGDIVLALETIEREALAQGKTVRDHTTHLLVHGLLHLLGFDHERDADAGVMEAEEIKILKKLGVKNPYL